MKRFIAIPLLCGASLFGQADVPVPAVPQDVAGGDFTMPAGFSRPGFTAEQPAGRSAPAQPSGGASRGLDVTKVEQLLDPVSGLSIDPNSGTFGWKGKSFDLGTSRLMRSRFERYLNQSEMDIRSQDSYQELLSQVLELLSPKNAAGGDTIFSENVEQAYRILYQASDYPQDGGTSRVLAHMIYNSWRMREEIRETIQSMTEQERRLVEQERIVLNRRVMAEDRARSRTNAAYDAERNAFDSLRGSHENGAAMEEERLQTGRAKLELSGTRLTVKSNLAQFQFQSQIIYLMMQRRFEHGLMACYFYRALFKGSAQQIQVGDQFLAQFFPQGDMVYTVEALEQIAQEAILDTANSMESARYSMDEGEVFTAMERLQESFYLGEYLKSVNTFPREQRQEILRVYRLMTEARELLALKDFDALLAANQKLMDISKSPRYSEIVSYSRNAKQLANLKLAQARFLISQNSFEKAQLALQESSEIWPLNPELSKFIDTAFAQSDLASTAISKFDAAYSNGSYRAIFNERYQMGAGLAADALRAGRLQEVIEKVGTADLLLAQARALSAEGHSHAAWELIMKAEEVLPLDIEVVSLRSAILPEVHEYARMLGTARRFAKEGNYAVSYAWYENAKDVYPASQVAAAEQRKLLPLISSQIK